MKMDDLEVVAEDVLEDRYSVMSSAQKGDSLKLSGSIGVKPSLPMKRADFLKAYASVLTE